MPRIAENEIQRLKEEVMVQRLVEGAGIELKRAGKDWLGRCLFHDDREASLVVTPGKNLWHCFGCQIGGGPIDWVMKHRGVSFRHAVELLRESLAGGLPSLAASAAEASPAAPLKRTSVRALAAPVSLDADDQRVLDETIEYYHQRMQDVPEARAYLAARGLDHPQVVEHFKLGVADRSLGLRLPEKNRAAGGAIRTQLQRIGLLRQSGHEHFNGSLVVPVFDAAGHVVEVYGRKLRDDLRPGTPKHLYLPGPHAGVFNLGGVVEAGQREPGSREVILCEALIDALTFWVHGFTNVTSAFGIEGFTDDLLQAFKTAGIERVLIAYDRDEPGERAAEKLAPRLIAEGLEVLRVQFPQGHDANEFARLQPNPKQALGLVLRQALWLGRAPQPPAVPLPVLAPAPATVAAQPEAPPSLAADPAPVAQATSGALVAGSDALNVEAVPDELHIEQGGCQWRVRGWRKNLSPEQMRVNVQVRRVSLDGSPAGYHMDTLDVYSAKARASFIRQAAIELGLSDESVKRDLGHVLLRLETLQDEAIRATKAPKQTAVVLNAQDEADALALLRDPDLCERIAADLQACGVVGERTNLLAGYLAAVSRKLDTPLAVLIQSSSAAGKSSLMEAVLNLVPPEERIQYSAMTGQSLFYLGETDLKHKILAIAEEEGVRQAAYALKLLQSEGQLTMASTGKDETTGNLVTKQYRVEGPVMLMLTTTAIDVDEELMNRCLVLTVNESREQTRAIHERQRQRQTLDGLLAGSHKETLIALHRNAQRLLRPIHVVNPYADQLTFVDHQTRTRRDHTKYLSLIRAIALLHQHQREVKTVEHRGQTLAYIEVTKADIAQANEIAHEVLGRTLDELPPQTRTLLMLVRDWVHGQCIEHGITQADWRFTRKQVRAATHWGDTQLKVHLARLVELEHLALHRKGLSHEYELVYDAKAGADRPHLNGLLSADDLGQVEQGNAYDLDRSGLGDDQSASGRGLVGGLSAIGRGAIECEQAQQPCGLQGDEASVNGHDAANALFRQDGKSPVVAVAARG